jgi:dipeptidyl-peptidase-4
LCNVQNYEIAFTFIKRAHTIGEQLVSEKWGLSWNAYLVSQKNYILVEVDGRGTGFQGESIRHAIYKKLGSIEVTDQMEVVRYVRSLFSSS